MIEPSSYPVMGTSYQYSNISKKIKKILWFLLGLHELHERLNNLRAIDYLILNTCENS